MPGVNEIGFPLISNPSKHFLLLPGVQGKIGTKLYIYLLRVIFVTISRSEYSWSEHSVDQPRAYFSLEKDELSESFESRSVSIEWAFFSDAE